MGREAPLCCGSCVRTRDVLHTCTVMLRQCDSRDESYLSFVSVSSGSLGTMARAAIDSQAGPRPPVRHPSGPRRPVRCTAGPGTSAVNATAALVVLRGRCVRRFVVKLAPATLMVAVPMVQLDASSTRQRAARFSAARPGCRTSCTNDCLRCLSLQLNGSRCAAMSLYNVSANRPIAEPY